MEAAIGHQPARPARAASPGISAVLDVLDVLDVQGPATLAQLARETGIAKSTLHRVCLMMSERGWVARDPRSGYIELGPRVAWLARGTPLSPLTAGFHAISRRLVARHNETTCLTVLDGRDSVFIAKEETTHAVRLVTAVGSRLPAFAAASGRAMLADRAEDEVAALYEGCELETPTGRRLDGIRELLGILREARRRGYAENIDETALGLHCLAVPVGPPGRVVAAITLCVPSGRMSPARKREMLPDLMRAARDIVPRPLEGGRPRVGEHPLGASRPLDGDRRLDPNPPLDGDPAPPDGTRQNRSNKLKMPDGGAIMPDGGAITTDGGATMPDAGPIATRLDASIRRHRGRRRPDPNRKVAP